MAVKPLTPEQIGLVKATVPVLKTHGEAITAAFYENLLAAHPSLRNLFNASSMASGRQPRALAGAVLAYAAHADNPAALLSAVDRIAHKHVSLGVEPAQYPIVGQFLLGAIAQVLGPDVATPAIIDAWAAAYAVLADIFITVEDRMRADNAAADKAAWSGFRRFRVARRDAESSVVSSLYLVPADGEPRLPPFRPGQFVSLRVRVPGLDLLQCRQYSLSEAPRADGAHYRISVKREIVSTAGPEGLVSSALHGSAGAVGAEVELSLPQGDFFADPLDKSKEGAPAVLISAGIGATPLMAILGGLTGEQAVRRPVSWVHASRSRAEMPFGDAVRRICRDNENVSAHVFLKSLGVDDKAGVDYEFGETRLDLEKLHGDRDLYVGNEKAEYFVCGPEAFMMDVRRALVGMGVERERVHVELFAAGGVAER